MNPQDLAQELGQSIHDIMAKHMRPGEPINVAEILSITVASLTPNLGDLISFIPDKNARPKAVAMIRQQFGNNLANSIEEYLLR